MHSTIKSKLEEICFFVGLIERLEINQSFKFFPNSESPEKEAEFLFSAALNSMYSTLEVFINNLTNLSREQKKPILAEVKAFKVKHGFIYNDSPGLRNFSVHRGHLKALGLSFLAMNDEGQLSLRSKLLVKDPNDDEKYIHGFDLLQCHLHNELVPFLNTFNQLIAEHST